jgi:hypothetical protein
MGQNLMNWMMSAGSQFDEFGPQARDRSQAAEARESQAEDAGLTFVGLLAAIAAFADFASRDRSRRAATASAVCCAAA